nr:hypothetical protein [Streptomyces sp. 846.5]
MRGADAAVAALVVAARDGQLALDDPVARQLRLRDLPTLRSRDGFRPWRTFTGTLRPRPSAATAGAWRSTAPPPATWPTTDLANNTFAMNRAWDLRPSSCAARP